MIAEAPQRHAGPVRRWSQALSFRTRARLGPITRELLLRRAVDITAESSQRSAVIVAPHPDDEVLGCAATILRKRAAGTAVHVVFASDGSSSNTPPDASPAERARIRRREAIAAAGILDLDEHHLSFLDMTDGGLAEPGAGLAERLATIIGAARPQEVLAPSIWDPHADHRAVSLAVRRLVAERDVRWVVSEYPVWFWKLAPWVRGRAGGAAADPLWLARVAVESVSTADLLDRKRAALAAYASRTNLHPRFLEHFFSSGELFFPQSAAGAPDA